MDYDASDILGGGTLPIGRNQPHNLWSTTPDFAKTSLYIVCGLVFSLLVRQGYHGILRWQERGHRKATRRRHGIPDSDERPFNVAYAAAVNARQEGDAQSNAGLRLRTAEHQPPSTAIHATGRGSSQYVANIPGGLSTYPIRGSSTNLGGNSAGTFSGHTRYDVPPTSTTVPGSIDIVDGKSDPANFAVPHTHNHSPRKGNKVYTSSTRPFKRTLEGGHDSVIEMETNKRCRVTEDEMSSQEGDHIGGSERRAPLTPKRGSKRLASSGDDDKDRRDKRARKVSRDHVSEQVEDEPMEEDADLSDSMQNPRGKKRDRGDAGSTFGGDEDSFVGDEDEKHRRHRRRRISSMKKHPRGQKRGRDLQTVESDNEAELGQSVSRRSRKKRGRNTSGSEGDIMNIEAPPISVDTLCNGRDIGEEWERNGIRYKVGPNGDRLRQTLVKRNRPKYPMPVDSEHPDKDVMIEVIVETWLTEDEYRTAKERFELAWQDPPQSTTTAEPETPGNVHTPLKGGKNLLWSSTASRPESPVLERQPFRQSIATNIGLHLNPFQHSQYIGKGRVTSDVYSPIAPSPDTPKLRHTKSYSKWEKQDLEAEAMAKIRQRLHEQKKTAEEQNKPTVPQRSTPAPPGPSLPSTIPNFPTQASSKSLNEDEAGTPSNAATTSASSVAKELQNPFAFAPAATQTPSNPTPPISFGNPLTSTVIPDTTKPPAPVQTSSMPNFFGIKASSSSLANALGPIQPSKPSQLSSVFPPTNPVPTPAKPSFTFQSQANPPTLGATTFSEQPKKAEPAPKATSDVPLAPGASFPAAPSAPSGRPSFSFSTAGQAPSENQPKFTFGMTSQPSSSGPTTFMSGGTQQPQQSTSFSPFGNQQQPTTQSSQPMFSFGTTGTQAKRDSVPIDMGASNKSQPFGGFGGTSSPFPSSNPSANGAVFGRNGDKDPAAMEASKPPSFSFGISSAPTTGPASSKPPSNPFGGGAFSAPAQPNAFNETNSSVGAGTQIPKDNVSANRIPSTMTQPAFSFSPSNQTSNAPSITSSATSSETPKPSFTFGTPGTSNDTTNKPNFTFGASAAAPTPSAFGFGAAPSSTFNFGKPEERK